MRLLLLNFLIWLLLPLLSQAQTTVSGQVTDKNKRPLEGVNVYLENTVLGASTDSTGNFHFRVDTSGSFTLVVSHLGYKTYRTALTIRNRVLPQLITLSVDPSTLDPIIVTAGSFNAGDRSKGAALTPIDVVGVSGSNGDVALSLRSLPGTGQIGEQEGLFVRGGSSDESKQFIDGTLFRSPNLSPVPGIIQPPRITPFLFKGILFSSGGYSALYGQALSGALILESVDLPDRSSAIIGLAPNLGTAGFQRLARNQKSSYGINVRYVNNALYNRLVPQRPDYFAGPRFLTIDGNYRIKTSQTGIIKFYLNTTGNCTGLRQPDVDSIQLQNGFQVWGRNMYANVSYREMLGQTWKVEAGISYNDNYDRIKNRLLATDNRVLQLAPSVMSKKNNNMDARERFAQGRVVFTHFFPHNHILKFGSEHFYTKDHYRFQSYDTASVTVMTDHLTALFAETDIFFSPNLTARLGLRYEYSSHLGRSALAPRLSLAYRFLDEGQLNLAYGVFYQKPDNRYLIHPISLDYQQATHYIINYSRKKNNRFFRMEAYYKHYAHLIQTTPELSVAGKGHARGIELFWRDKRSIKNTDYWVSYTYLHTRRQYLNFPQALQPAFATPHTASLVAQHSLEKLKTSIGIAYTFATGRPYYFIGKNTETGQSIIGDKGITQPYSNLNVKLSYRLSLLPTGKDFTVLAAGINNLLGADPVFGYRYSADGLMKAPTTLPATRIYFIGLFMNLGIDRTNDILNNEL